MVQISKITGLLIATGAFCLAQNAHANAAQIKGSDYVVAVELHHAQGVQGKLEILKVDANGNTSDTGVGCIAIGGNKSHWKSKDGSQAIDTPAGLHTVYDHTNPLIYNGKPDTGFGYASYFYSPQPGSNPDPRSGSGNKVAVHTATSYSENSHGCVRAPCALKVYQLQGKVLVNVQYAD